MSKRPTTIFILGAGVMQIPAIRAAKAMGWRVIVADGSPEAEGIALADQFVNVDLKDRDAMAAAVRLCQADRGVDGVFTAGTDFSATVAWAANQCGLPGLAYETTLNATDKARMRRVFREHGVPQPEFVELSRGDSARRALEQLSFPLVVKPVDNMGARGVRRIDTEEELEAAFAAAVGFSRSGRAIVEAYVSGPEYSLDALVWRGEPTLCGIADRHIFFEPYFVEMGHTMPAVLDEPTLAKIVAVFFRGIRALGIDNGAAKGDIKLSSRGAVVGEIAARLSGGYMSGWTFPYASGIDVTRSALRIAVGLPPLDLSPTERSWSAERAFISIPGRVDKVTGIEEARAQAGVKDIFLRVSAGATVTFPQNNVQKCGNVIAKGASRTEAIASAVGALSRIFIRLTPAREETTDFLFSRKPGRPAAFRFAVPENIEAALSLRAWYGDRDRSDPRRPVILALPRLDIETGADWHGVAWKRVEIIVTEMCGVRFVTHPVDEGFVLGDIFWKAIKAGGAQGAVYLCDTLSLLATRPTDLAAFLEKAGP